MQGLDCATLGQQRCCPAPHLPPDHARCKPAVRRSFPPASPLPPPIATVQGTLAQLDSKNPVMYLDFPQGRYKMFGASMQAERRRVEACVPAGGAAVLAAPGAGSPWCWQLCMLPACRPVAHHLLLANNTCCCLPCLPAAPAPPRVCTAGTLVFPKNKYLVLRMGQKDVLCEDVLESMVGCGTVWAGG